jgi:hypothetical protein
VLRRVRSFLLDPLALIAEIRSRWHPGEKGCTPVVLIIHPAAPCRGFRHVVQLELASRMKQSGKSLYNTGVRTETRRVDWHRCLDLPILPQIDFTN